MNTNLIDYIAWVIVVGVTLYILDSGMRKHEGLKFYSIVIGGMVVVFVISVLVESWICI